MEKKVVYVTKCAPVWGGIYNPEKVLQQVNFINNRGETARIFALYDNSGALWVYVVGATELEDCSEGHVRYWLEDVKAAKEGRERVRGCGVYKGYSKELTIQEFKDKHELK